jgi:hypothetical protein
MARCADGGLCNTWPYAITLLQQGGRTLRIALSVSCRLSLGLYAVSPARPSPDLGALAARVGPCDPRYAAVKSLLMRRPPHRRNGDDSMAGPQPASHFHGAHTVHCTPRAAHLQAVGVRAGAALRPLPSWSPHVTAVSMCAAASKLLRVSRFSPAPLGEAAVVLADGPLTRHACTPASTPTARPCISDSTASCPFLAVDCQRPAARLRRSTPERPPEGGENKV